MPASDTKFSGTGREPSNHSYVNQETNGGGNTGSMLSLDFSAPLAGPARQERIKQMSKNHAAFGQSRRVQEILCKVQTSLRRMPGVSSNESNEIVNQLQEVGQIISQETSQLVDALMNLTLDQDDTEKAVSRMSIEASLAKAEADGKAQTIKNLREELEVEKFKRVDAETDVKKIMEELQSLSNEYKAFKDKTRSNSSGSPASDQEMVKTLGELVKHLEDQVNNRRSLWVLKHQDPQMIAQAIETMAGSLQDKEILQRSLSSIQSAESKNEHAVGAQKHKDTSPNFGELSSPPPQQAQSGFQHIGRSPTAVPSRYSPFHSGPPRTSSVYPSNRQFQIWGPGTGGGHSSRAVSMGTSLTSPTPFSRAPFRRGGCQGQSRYRPNAPEFQPSIFAESAPNRPGTAFGQRRDYCPNPQASSGRGRYGSHMQGAADGGHGGGNGALVPHIGQTGPLIHLTERSVMAWGKQIADFYSAIRNFVDNHAGQPMSDADHSLGETNLWPILIRTYLPLSEMEATSYLEFHLKDQNAKRCLVTRVIVDYVVNLVWVAGAWKGADEQTSYALTELERDLARTHGQPSSARQPFLDKQAAIIDSIMKHHDPDSTFYKNKIEEIAGTLLTNLEPLINRLTSPYDAYRDLVPVAENAWDLSSKILTSRLTFDFRFPEIGSRFSSQSMVPIWPPDIGPMELQAKHWRVAMVTTPVITCRNDTGTNISAHSVSLADVICMQ